MKKNLFAILILLAALFCSIALAENTEFQSEVVSGKINLWEHEVVVFDEAGNVASYPMVVTFEAKEPVTMTRLPVSSELEDEVFICNVTREGLGNVMIALSPANRGLHYNLNDYTDEMLQEYIQSVADANFAEGEYTAEVMVSEGGNTYVRLGTEYEETLSTIYDDFTMEFYLVHMGEHELQPLTDADKDFAVEIFQSVWTEEAEIPATDTEITVFVNEKVLADLGIEGYEKIVDVLNQASILFHTQDNLIHLAVKNGDEEIVNYDVTQQEDGALLQSNVLGDKAIFLSSDFLALSTEGVENGDIESIPTAIEPISFDKTISAVSEAVVTDIGEDGTITVVIPSENAVKVLNAIGEDLKDSGKLSSVLSFFGMEDIDDETIAMFVDYGIESIAQALPEDDFVSIVITMDETGMFAAGALRYNGVDYDYDEEAGEFVTIKVPYTVEIAAQLETAEDGTTNLIAQLAMGALEGDEFGGLTLSASILPSGEYSGELLIGSLTEGEIQPVFGVTLRDVKASDANGNLETIVLTFSMANDSGELEEAVSFANVFTGLGKENTQALMISVAGYDDPVVLVRTVEVFAEEVTVDAPAEIIRAEEIDEAELKVILDTVMEKLQSIPSNIR